MNIRSKECGQDKGREEYTNKEIYIESEAQEIGILAMRIVTKNPLYVTSGGLGTKETLLFARRSFLWSERSTTLDLPLLVLQFRTLFL